MGRSILRIGLSAAAVLAACAALSHAQEHPWLASDSAARSLAQRIPAPPGAARLPVAPGSFGEWLRGLPLKEGRPPVHLHDGRLKANQEAHWAVLDIDTGERNLQQCADAVIRLRAEYLYAKREPAAIAFDFTSGDRAPFSRWAEGERPRIQKGRVVWARSAEADGGYRSFRRYLDVVFTYAGSASLARELLPVADVGGIEPGDVFVRGGFPGHAALVIDVALDARTHRRLFLLAQSFMPAQEIHVLKNPSRADDPWYDTDFETTLVTPEWTFLANELRRFR